MALRRRKGLKSHPLMRDPYICGSHLPHPPHPLGAYRIPTNSISANSITLHAVSHEVSPGSWDPLTLSPTDTNGCCGRVVVRD